MRWAGRALLVVAGLALAYYPLVMTVFAGLFMLDALHRDARREWQDLWRGTADAVVTEIRTRCSIREWQLEGQRRRLTSRDVPCDRVDAEVAARPGQAQPLGPVREIVIAFTTEEGRPIEAVSYSGVLRLPDPVEAGQRLRVSYDPKKPGHVPYAATGIGALVTLVMLHAALLAAVYAAGRWLWRRLAGAWARLGR